MTNTSVPATRTAGTAVGAVANLRNALQNVKSHIRTAGGDPILRLLKDGVWVYGQENIEVEDGSQWALNVPEIMHGWVAWTDYDKDELKTHKRNEIVHEVMVPMTEPLPPADALPKTEWRYTQQIELQFMCVSGADVGTQVCYKTTSAGGMNAVNKLIGELMAQLDKDPNKPIPLCVFQSDSYQHKTYGKTYVPVIAVSRWVEMTEDMPEAASEAAQPKATRGAKARAAEEQAAKAPEMTAEQRRIAELEAALAAAKTSGQDEEQQSAAAEANAPARRRRHAA